MKKISKILILTSILTVMLFSVCGCGNNDETEESVEKTKAVEKYEKGALEYTFDDNTMTAAVKGIKSDKKSSVKEVNIPSKVKKDGKTYEVNKIESSAFKGNVNITKVTIPDSITKICMQAFENDVKLEEIVIPNSVTSIDKRICAGCTNLKKAELPEKLDDGAVCNGWFNKCTNLEEVNIPSGVTEISQNAFYECKNLRKVTLPDTVTKIGNSAFRLCSNLSEITIPKSVEEIQNYAFFGCTNITINVEGRSRAPKGWYDWDTVASGKKADVKWDENAPVEELTFEEKQVDKLSDVSWNYKKIDLSNLKWLNTEKYGNICIPSNWELDSSVAALAGDSIIAYGLSDASQTIILKDCAASSASSEIQTLLTKLQSDESLEEWAYRKATVNGKNAVIIQAKFKGIEHIQSTLYIATPDQSRMVVVCVEAGDPELEKILNTFTFEKSDQDAVEYYKSVNK